jgi:hypothetical protein
MFEVGHLRSVGIGTAEVYGNDVHTAIPSLESSSKSFM